MTLPSQQTANTPSSHPGHTADDSTVAVMNTKTAEIERSVSACVGCHKAAGVEVKIDKGSPLLCGIEIDWHTAKK